MELKEARYILAIAQNKSISKAAESLYISQPSLSKYLKNLEEQIGTKLFNRIENNYIPTYAGERYLYYAKKIVGYGTEWLGELDDIMNRNQGRLNIAIPIMLSNTIIQPTLPLFHRLYPNVIINLMEQVNFVAEHALEDQSIDITFYNVHEFPKQLDYHILSEEEIVLIVSGNSHLCSMAVEKPGFKYPWLDMKQLKDEQFILLYPDQNTGGIALKLFKEHDINPQVLLHTRNSEMSIKLAAEGMGIAFAPESYYRAIGDTKDSRCFSIGKKQILTTTIAAYPKNRYLPQYAKAYIEIISVHCASVK